MRVGQHHDAGLAEQLPSLQAAGGKRARDQRDVGLARRHQRRCPRAAGIPDLHYEIRRCAAAGDLVAVHTRVTGTNTGELFGAPASGSAIDMRQMQFERLHQGHIVEHGRITEPLAAPAS